MSNDPRVPIFSLLVGSVTAPLLAASITRVLTTSIGVVTTAAIVPDTAAENPVSTARSSTGPISCLVTFAPSFFFASRHSTTCDRMNSNIGKCKPVKGRLRPTNAAYPRHSFQGLCLNREITSSVAVGLCSPLPVCFCMTCAFCLSTSAGVSIRQETISAVEEAMAWAIGLGRECGRGRLTSVSLSLCDKSSLRMCFTAS